MRAAVPDVAIRPYRLSRVEYDRAVEAGAFEPDARLELIDGDLNAMTPEGVGHTTGMDLVADCLRRVFGSGFHVRIQHPLAVDDYSEPEPDVAVVKGTIRDYGKAHPTEAVLVVEVSHESLRYDRTVKQRLYARCGIPEYWILALLPEAVSRSTATRLETATRATPTMQPATRSRRSLAPTYRSSSTICFPDAEHPRSLRKKLRTMSGADSPHRMPRHPGRFRELAPA